MALIPPLPAHTPHVLVFSGLHLFHICCVWWYRDHILNIKDAPAPKPAGKGAKRTLEQATAAPPVTAAASAQPPADVSAAAATTAEAAAAEAEQPSDGQNTQEQPAAQEQTPSDADQPQLPGLAQETAQAGSSEAPQADGEPVAMVSVVCQDMCICAIQVMRLHTLSFVYT